MTDAIRRTSRAGLLLITLAATVIASGCFEFERSIVLNKDLTGKASFRMVVDLEAFLPTLIQIEHEKEGKPGPATAEEISTMKSMMGLVLGSLPPLVDEKALTASLPAGVTLVDNSQKVDALKISAAVNFAFTDITKLPLVTIPMASEGSHDKNPLNRSTTSSSRTKAPHFSSPPNPLRPRPEQTHRSRLPTCSSN